MTSSSRPERVERLARDFHTVYQKEARRQGDTRHPDDFDALPENIKDFDRVLARYVLDRFQPEFREFVEGTATPRPWKVLPVWDDPHRMVNEAGEATAPNAYLLMSDEQADVGVGKAAETNNFDDALLIVRAVNRLQDVPRCRDCEMRLEGEQA